MAKDIDLTAYELLELLYPDEEDQRVLEKPEDRISWDGRDSEEQILGRIFSRTYSGASNGSGEREAGPGRKKFGREGKRRIEAGSDPELKTEQRKTCILVDGYNMIFSWEELKKLAAEGDYAGARKRLLERLLIYKTMRGVELIAVFDAYKVPQGTGSEEDFYGIRVVYTKEAETADQFIERESADKELNREYNIKVATSDSIEQLIAYAHGAKRMSARELELETRASEEELAKLRMDTHTRRMAATLGDKIIEGD